MKDAADDAAIVCPARAGTILRQMRLDGRPGLVTDPIDVFHARLLRFFGGVIRDLHIESIG
jgi:hypothetical protein